MISQQKRDVTRGVHAEFKRLLTEGDRADPQTMVRLVELSGFLAEAVPYLLDEIERLAERQVS